METKNKSFIIGCIFMSCIFVACAMSGKPKFNKNILRSDQSRAWEPCQDKDGKIGEFCVPHCPKGKRKKDGKCRVKLDVKKRNFCEKDDFLFFRSGDFILVDIDYL